MAIFMEVFSSGRSRSGIVFEAGQPVAEGVDISSARCLGWLLPSSANDVDVRSAAVFVSVGRLSAPP
jgi:hypothetical protein